MHEFVSRTTDRTRAWSEFGKWKSNRICGRRIRGRCHSDFGVIVHARFRPVRAITCLGAEAIEEKDEDGEQTEAVVEFDDDAFSLGQRIVSRPYHLFERPTLMLL